jgi:hypothetical protein
LSSGALLETGLEIREGGWKMESPTAEFREPCLFLCSRFGKSTFSWCSFSLGSDFQERAHFARQISPCFAQREEGVLTIPYLGKGE